MTTKQQRHVMTTWYEDGEGVRYSETAPDLIMGDMERHRKAAYVWMAKNRPTYLPASCVAVVKIERW